MVKKISITNKSFEKQYNESNENYSYFKIYLKQGKDRSIKKVHAEITANATGTISAGTTTTPNIAQLTLISDRWKWIYRAVDYDHYKNILSHHNQAQQQIGYIDKQLSYLRNVATTTINNNAMLEKDRLYILGKVAKNEKILTDERQKSYKIIKKTGEELKNYDKNKYNFKAEKQKDLINALNDYNNGFIDKTEYNVITLDYPEKLIERIENQYNNPMESVTKLMNPIEKG